MARRSLGSLLASAPDVDRLRLATTTEAEIREQARADGDDPDAEPGAYRLVLPPRAVRERLGMTQAAFAAALRIPVGTVRNWEQARTLPDPAARSLLDAVAQAPVAVLTALNPDRSHDWAALGARLTRGSGPDADGSDARRTQALGAAR